MPNRKIGQIAVIGDSQTDDEAMTMAEAVGISLDSRRQYQNEVCKNINDLILKLEKLSNKQKY